jgi:hypothetical protein
MHIPRSTAILLILLWMAGSTLAQAPPAGDLQCKSVSDTILGQRLLVLPYPFRPKRALARLFPGKWYDLSQPKFANQLISWKCPRCTPKIYPDVNEMDTLLFPDPAGVATRLLNVFTYTDSSGREVKVMSFNHSGYDPDGMQTGRYSGGLLGFATFVHVDRSWRLEKFQPAIAAYGSFSQAPKSRPLEIGEGQYGFVIDHVNGGPGGPFWQNIYLIADLDGTFQQILAAYGTGRTTGFDGKSSWTATYAGMPNDKRVCRDMVITCKGHFVAPDPEGLPPELKGKFKAGQQGEFTIRHLYVYSAKKGYQEQLPAKVTLQDKR